MSVHDIKEPHEIAVCRDFLRFYNAKFNSQYDFVRHGRAEDKEPDCICSDGLNIEIVNIYHGKDHAEFVNQFERGETKEVSLKIEEPDKKAFLFLRDNLEKKEKKKYNHDGKLFLLIDATTQGTFSKDYEQYLRGKKYSSSVFNEIWLRTSVNGRQNAFLKIFPSTGLK